MVLVVVWRRGSGSLCLAFARNCAHALLRSSVEGSLGAVHILAAATTSMTATNSVELVTRLRGRDGAAPEEAGMRGSG